MRCKQPGKRGSSLAIFSLRALSRAQSSFYSEEFEVLVNVCSAQYYRELGEVIHGQKKKKKHERTWEIMTLKKETYKRYWKDGEECQGIAPSAEKKYGRGYETVNYGTYTFFL